MEIDECRAPVAGKRAGILDAPPSQRLAARTTGLLPEPLGPTLRPSVVPPAAVTAQKSTR